MGKAATIGGTAAQTRRRTIRPATPRDVALATAGFSILLGASVLFGWAASVPLMTSWLPGLVAAKVNAAICFALIGVGIGLLQLPSDRPVRKLTWVVAAIVAAIAGATLFEHISGVDFGIDQAFAADVASAASPHPGRIAVQTAVAFLAAALAVVAMGRRIRGAAVSEALGVLVAIVGGVSLLGYLYGARDLISLASATEISLPASIALMIVGLGIISAREDHALVRLWEDTGAAGDIIRRMLPAAIIVIPAGAWLRLVGERAGLYDESVGLSIMVAFEALVLVMVWVWTTSRVRRLERERVEALADLIRLGTAASTPLIETAPVGLAVLDRDLRYLYVNPTLAAIGGMTPLSSLGQRIDLIMPAFGNAAMTTLAGAVKDGVPARDVEVTGDLRSGARPGTWLLSAEPLRDASGDVVGLAISVVDITERKHREEALSALAEVQRQAQAIGESIPFGIWLADSDGLMRYLSKSFLDMSGQTMERARDLGWLASLAADSADKVKRDWAETIAARLPWNSELMVEAADGKRRAILSRGFPVRDDTGRVTSWAGINLDVTDRKDAEEYREAFLTILSHELATPVTSIYAASTLLSRPGLDDERRAELLNDIGQESERLRRLIEDLVVLAHVERGTLKVHTDPVPLAHVLRKVCDQEKRRWPDNEFELTVSARLPVAAADDAFVEQIVRNLVENAAKYGPPGATVEVVADAHGGAPRVRVLDRGPGIDPAEAERLFEVFYRSQRTMRVAGSGIGLFVAHRLVESIGGTIWARSREDGPGAEVGFELRPFTEDAV